MESSAAEHARTAVFAAKGPTRHRLGRVAIVAGIGLLAVWLVALALGALGGFESLPGLPRSHAESSTDATHKAQPEPKSAAVEQDAVAETQTGGGSSAGPSRPAQSPSHTASPPATAPPPAPSTSTGTAAKTSHGQGLGITKDTGKPIDSPGNGPGGTGAPGQLR